MYKSRAQFRYKSRAQFTYLQKQSTVQVQNRAQFRYHYTIKASLNFCVGMMGIRLLVKSTDGTASKGHDSRYRYRYHPDFFLLVQVLLNNCYHFLIMFII